MRVHADLADEPELVEALEERAANGRALADEGECLGVPEPLGENVDVLGVILPDRHVVAGHRAEAGQRPDGVLVVVENGDVHDGRGPATRRPPAAP